MSVGYGWTLWLLLQTAMGDAPCGEVDDVLQRAETALLEWRLDALERHELELQSRWSCGEPATAEELSRAWLIRAAKWEVQDSNERAGMAWQAAARISPGSWNPQLGDQLRERYDAATEAPEFPYGTLSLTDELTGTLRLYMDGEPISLPSPVPAGPHLLQTIDRRRDVRGALIFRVGPDEHIAIDIGDIQVSPTHRRGPRWMLAFSGISAGLAGSAVILAMAQDQAMIEASSRTELDQAFERQKRFAVAAYGLGGLALAGSVSWFFY